MTTRVLYLAAGNPIRPSVGMDLVIRQHLTELATDTSIQLTAVAVAPGIPGSQDVGYFPIGRSGVHVFVGDLKGEKKGFQRFWSKLKFVVLRDVPVMAYSFKSLSAQRSICDLLKTGNFDVVVVDHYYTLANVSLKDISRSGSKLVYISHDAMLPHVAEMASMRKDPISKIYYYLESLRTHWVEQRLFARATRIVHLSEYECRRVKVCVERHLALLPPIVGRVTSEGADAARDYAHSVLFIGAPAHPPNAHAIDWILHCLSPALAKRDPTLKIVLIGGGTQCIQSDYGNVHGLGFVSQAELQRALGSAIGAISPVVLGRGIKVKVLDAIAAGCPVWATEESLRGFEQFGLDANLALNAPDALVDEIVQLAKQPHRREQVKAKLVAAWQHFMSSRPGQLAQLVTKC